MPSAPMCTTQERAKVSTHLLLTVSISSTLPRSSAIAKGLAVMPWAVKVVIWISREGAPHAVAIDHWDAQSGGDIDRHDRIETAGFDAHGAAGLASGITAERFKCADHVMAGRQLFDDNDGRAHTG